MKQATLVFILLAPIISQAAGGSGGHDDHGHIPFAWIGWQTANFGILLTVIFFLIKKSVVDGFAARRENYLNQAEKTKAALRDAEAALSDIKAKLNTLESGEQKSIESAKREATALKENILRDAETASMKLKKDAEQIISTELNKAKEEINAAILNQAIQGASQKISTSGVNQEASFLKQLEQVRA